MIDRVGDDGDVEELKVERMNRFLELFYELFLLFFGEVLEGELDLANVERLQVESDEG